MIHALRTMIIAFMALGVMVGTVASATSRDIVAVDYPPMMIKDGQLPGFSIEIITEAARRVGEDVSVQFLPFQRAVKIVQHRTDVIHPALYRNSRRENDYTWMAKYMSVNNVFLTLREPIDTIEAARELKSIGVEAKAQMDMLMTELGFKNLERVERAELNARKLMAQRLDAWALTDMLALWKWRELGMSEPLIPGKPVSFSPVYLVAGPDFSQEIADRYERAIREMLDDGTIEKILQKYR